MENSLHMNRISICRIRNGSRSDSNVLRSFRLYFLILLFWTDSNKVVFLILWIVSLFALATYLILVEYVDYNL